MTTFDASVPWEIREQILKYQATFCMSDVERARFLGLPEGCRIRENAKIISQTNLKIGTHCWIGEGAVLDASGGLTIGSHTSIGLGVYVWTHDSHKLNVGSTNTAAAKHLIKRKPTVIGSNCFVAGPSVVMPGVKVGDGCVIGPMSVVFNDLPEGTIFTPYREFTKLLDTVAVLEARIRDLEARLPEKRANG